jgi:hypothetical protein
VQELRRANPGNGRDTPCVVDRRGLPALYGEASLLPAGDLPRTALDAPHSEARQIGELAMGEMKRAVAPEEEARIRDRFASTLVIIAAVRLAKDENISRSCPRVFIVISDSIALARGILDKVAH